MEINDSFDSVIATQATGVVKCNSHKVDPSCGVHWIALVELVQKKVGTESCDEN